MRSAWRSALVLLAVTLTVTPSQCLLAYRLL